MKKFSRSFLKKDLPFTMGKAEVPRFLVVLKFSYFCRKFLTLNFKQKLTDSLKTVFPSTKFEGVLFLVFLTIFFLVREISLTLHSARCDCAIVLSLNSRANAARMSSR